MQSYTLSGGVQIPVMGYGCYNAFGDEIAKAVEMALEAGYRYIDSAEFYKNEPDIGPALDTFAGRREELFILSKAWPSSYENMEEACLRTMKNLHVEYLDAYLLHWPGTKEERRLTGYGQLLGLVEKGLVRAPGVSNFSIEQLERIKEEYGAYPAIHEIECHPSYHPEEMIRFCKERGIQIISYEPINRTADLSLAPVLKLAEKYAHTPAQVVLRWHIQHDQLPIPKSSNEKRIRENIAVFDFELSKEDMDLLDTLDTGKRSGLDPLAFPPGF